MAKFRKKTRINVKFIIVPILLIFLIYFLMGSGSSSSNEGFIKKILRHSSYYYNPEYESENYLFKLLGNITNVELDKPISILDKSITYYVEQQVFAYMNNQNIVSNPRVYIYNTHPSEFYDGTYVNEYQMEASVVTATLTLQEKLNELGVSTIVDPNNVSKYIYDNNLTFSDSYAVSRIFVNKTLKEYSDFDLIIDLHRDAVAEDISTVIIDGVNYAKILFVMCTVCDNYEFGVTFNNFIKSRYPELTRGVYDRTYDFNQDLASNMVLLEFGGDKNSYESVLNTVDLMANLIKEFLDER